MTQALGTAAVADAGAQIFRDNIDLYVRHAEELTLFRVEQWSQLAHWKRRYGRIENLVSRVGDVRRGRARR